jgi:hypothetical protein
MDLMLCLQNWVWKFYGLSVLLAKLNPIVVSQAKPNLIVLKIWWFHLRDL